MVFDSVWLLIEISQWSDEAYRSIRKVNKTGWRLATSKEREIRRARMLLEVSLHKIYRTPKGYLIYTKSKLQPYNKYGVCLFASNDVHTYIQKGDQVYARILWRGLVLYKKFCSKCLHMRIYQDRGEHVYTAVAHQSEDYFLGWAIMTHDELAEFNRLLETYRDNPFDVD